MAKKSTENPATEPEIPAIENDIPATEGEMPELTNPELLDLHAAQNEAIEALSNRLTELENENAELRTNPVAAAIPSFEVELDDCRVRVLHGLMMKDEYEVWRPYSAAEIAENPALVKQLLAQKSTAVEVVE